ALQIDANGRTENRQIALKGTVRSGLELSANVEGQIDLSRSDPAFDIQISGTANTSIAAARLADMGARLSGRAGFNVRVRGTADRPQLAGAVSLSNATLGDAEGRFVVTGATGRFEFSKDRLRIVSLRGRSGRSGAVQVAGTVGLADPMPADVRVQIQNGTYADGTLVHTLYDANLRLSGPLAGSPLLSGQIGLKKTKITLSEVPPTALRPLEVRHKRPPPMVREQMQQLRARGGGGSSNIRLDLRITALESISVSGRGLSALLGGGLNLSGTPSALVATGSFGLRRGVLKLLGRRLVFESGRLDFDRDLDPRLNLVAVSRSSDSTIRLVIAGRASAPTISVTSSPELPEEEALARLVFDRDLLELSPLQVAQLAGSIAVLSGGGGGGVLDGLQDTLGVDWLEVTETPSGETAVGIGKQLDERLSIGVEQSTKSATSRVIIDLGVTKNFKLRGAAGSDGSSRAGVIFEKDY
ncbi:MAG: translocation/assembly module TamB domain-containing protein, partial [Pseudomonadota bacterium]